MHIEFNATDEVAERLATAAPAGTLWLLLVADRHGHDVESLIERCRARDLKICGGVFPGLIRGAERLDHGIIALALPPGSVAAVARAEAAGPAWIVPPPECDRTAAPGGSYVLVDCLAPGISRLLDDLYDRYGTSLRHAGAGCGYHDLRNAPTVFWNGGWIPQGALITVFPGKSTVAVRHGWTRVGKPFIASRTRGNRIDELDWEPAGVQYLRAVTEQDPALAGRPVFPDINSSFPLALGKEGAEDVIRDPIAVNDDGSLTTLSEVPENCVLYLAHGDGDTLVAAAKEAVDACSSVTGIERCFVSDCFSRAIAHGESFGRELAAVCDALARYTDVVPEGVLALGEVAASGRHSLEFYNKTFVVALAHR